VAVEGENGGYGFAFGCASFRASVVPGRRGIWRWALEGALCEAERPVVLSGVQHSRLAAIANLAEALHASRAFGDLPRNELVAAMSLASRAAARAATAASAIALCGGDAPRPKSQTAGKLTTG
jgi:hypothetical protein